MIQILLATCNGEKYLKQQLDSLLSQTYQDFEVLVRDDCSTDNTLNILKEYKEKYPGKFKITVNETPTGNAKDNFFLLMNDASSDYIMFCDQDDVWLPDKIEITLKKMLECEENKPCLIHTDLFVTDENLRITHKSFFKMQHFEKCVDNTPLNHTIVQNCVTGCSVMINKALLDLVKGKNHPDIIMHDWFLAIVASAFGKVSCLKLPTIYYRQHKNNSVGAKWIKYNRFSQVKFSIERTFFQAKYILSIYGNLLEENFKILIENYSNIKNLSPFKRLKFLNKNNMYKIPNSKKYIFKLIMFFS